MPLIKKLTMARKKIAANRSNGGQSLGPATEEGRGHCASVNLRYGLYAQARETALRGLGEDPDDRYPKITPDEWRARERARKLLRNILSRQVDVCESQRKALLRESLEGPSPYELAAEIAPNHAEALLMRRLQDANMREVRRLTNMLLKIKRRESKLAAPPTDDAGRGHDVLESEGT